MSRMGLARAQVFLDFLLQKVEVACLYIPASIDPNSVYETINSRGKQLDELDKIRNFLYSYFNTADDKSRRDTVHEHIEHIRDQVRRHSHFSDYAHCYFQAALRAKDPEFTTLAIVYNCNRDIIESSFPTGKVDTTHRPGRDEEELYRRKVTEVWETVLDGIEVFSDAVADREETGDDRRREIRRTNLLGRPVVQECVVQAFLHLTGAPTNMSPQEACSRLNRLPWSISEKNLHTWQRVLWTGGEDGKIITKNRRLATGMIAYMAGEKIAEEARRKLLKEYRQQFPEGERDRELPRYCEWRVETTLIPCSLVNRAGHLLFRRDRSLHAGREGTGQAYA